MAEMIERTFVTTWSRVGGRGCPVHGRQSSILDVADDRRHRLRGRHSTDFGGVIQPRLAARASLLLRSQRPNHVVLVAVRPRIARFLRPDHRMPAGGCVLAGVLILGVVAAPDRTTGHAESQVHPGVAHFDAGWASTLGYGSRGHILEIIAYVASASGHGGED